MPLHIPISKPIRIWKSLLLLFRYLLQNPSFCITLVSNYALIFLIVVGATCSVEIFVLNLIMNIIMSPINRFINMTSSKARLMYHDITPRDAQKHMKKITKLKESKLLMPTISKLILYSKKNMFVNFSTRGAHVVCSLYD